MSETEQEYFERMLEARFRHLDDKVDEIISLQKIANCRTTKNESRIIDLEKGVATSQGFWKATTIIGSIIGAAIGLISAILLR